MANVDIKVDDSSDAVAEQTEQAATETPTEQTDVEQVSSNQTSVKSSKMKPTKRAILEVVLLAAVILLGLYAWNLHSDRQNLTKQLTAINANPQSAVQKQTDELIASVGSLIQLPKGETPTVAAVTNADQAKKQSAFFNNAQNGDKVLLYVKAGEAILYRPSTNKIIVVAPLTFSGNGTGTTTPSTTKN